jgi:hypothetical protein
MSALCSLGTAHSIVPDDVLPIQLLLTIQVISVM